MHQSGGFGARALHVVAPFATKAGRIECRSSVPSPQRRAGRRWRPPRAPTWAGNPAPPDDARRQMRLSRRACRPSPGGFAPPAGGSLLGRSRCRLRRGGFRASARCGFPATGTGRIGQGPRVGDDVARAGPAPSGRGRSWRSRDVAPRDREDLVRQFLRSPGVAFLRARSAWRPNTVKPSIWAARSGRRRPTGWGHLVGPPPLPRCGSLGTAEHGRASPDFRRRSSRTAIGCTAAAGAAPASSAAASAASMS